MGRARRADHLARRHPFSAPAPGRRRVPRRVPRADRRDRQAAPSRRLTAGSGRGSGCHARSADERRRVRYPGRPTPRCGDGSRNHRNATDHRLRRDLGPAPRADAANARSAGRLRAPLRDHDADRRSRRGNARGRPPDDARPGPGDVLPAARRPVWRRHVRAHTPPRRPPRHPPARHSCPGRDGGRESTRGGARHAVPPTVAGAALRGRLVGGPAAPARTGGDPARLHPPGDVLVHARRVPDPRPITLDQGSLDRRGRLADPRRRRRSPHGGLAHAWRARDGHPRDGHRPVRVRPDDAELHPGPWCPELRRGVRPRPSAPAARRRPTAPRGPVPRPPRVPRGGVLRGQRLGARAVVRVESAGPSGRPVRMGRPVLGTERGDRASGDARSGRDLRPDVADEGGRPGT